MSAANPQNLPAERKPQVVAGGNVAALIPQSIDEAFRVANALSISGLAPRGMDRTEQVLAVIMAGSEIGFAPYQSVQSFAMVNNRPSLWGDAIPALLWSKGFELDEWFDNDDNPTKAFCKVTRPSKKTIERTFSLEDAKLAGLLNKQGTWQTNRKRMLQMRARAFAARDGASDALKGLPIFEEVQDHQHFGAQGVRAPGTGMRARLEARAAQVEPNGGFDADHIAAELAEDAEFTESTSPSNRDPSAGGEASSGAAPQGETPPAGTGAETPADREGQSQRRDGAEGQSGSSAQAEEFPGDRKDEEPEAWAIRINQSLDDFATVADLDDWMGDQANIDRFNALSKSSPGIAKTLDAALTGRKKALASKERDQ